MGSFALTSAYLAFRSRVDFPNFLQDYCAPKINYADVRKRVHHAYAEKANEIADAIAVVQRLSKEGATLLEEIRAQCA
jgi:DnaJ-domain-containing protein 1